jgi:hypothetical protein
MFKSENNAVVISHPSEEIRRRAASVLTKAPTNQRDYREARGREWHVSCRFNRQS